MRAFKRAAVPEKSGGGRKQTLHSAPPQRHIQLAIFRWQSLFSIVITIVSHSNSFHQALPLEMWSMIQAMCSTKKEEPGKWTFASTGSQMFSMKWPIGWPDPFSSYQQNMAIVHVALLDQCLLYVPFHGWGRHGQVPCSWALLGQNFYPDGHNHDPW